MSKKVQCEKISLVFVIDSEKEENLTDFWFLTDITSPTYYGEQVACVLVYYGGISFKTINGNVKGFKTSHSGFCVVFCWISSI